jgi:hypothetical protein
VTKERPCMHRESNDDWEARGFYTVGHGKGRKVIHSKLYQVWYSMRSRCVNANHRAYKHYGGRGISICEAWSDFGQFRAWAISSGYNQGLQIDRHPNNDGNYEPSNCRWATNKESMRNTSLVKLNTEKVEQIRAAIGSNQEIGIRFGISRRHINDIRSGKAWA